MPSMFNARDADNYERLMGRWSRRLAPLFIEHAGIADGENVIEIGCGTGSLTFTLPQKAALGRLTAVDHSEIYLAAAKAKNKDPRISLEQGDGCALRFPDASFDRALSMLVLPSVLPEPELMVAEMRRVTRPGGVVAAAFWDSPAGAPASAWCGIPLPHSTKRPPRRATARWGARSTRLAHWRACGWRPVSSTSTSDR